MFARIPLLAALALLALALAHAHVAGAWPTAPLVVRACAGSLCTPMAASDGAGGAFVTWREDSLPGSLGRLRAQHVLGGGTLDPTWPASGLAVRDSLAARTLVRVLPDASGGFYVTWLEGSISLFVQHVLGSGVFDPNWPVRGRLIASASSLHGPAIIEDGAGGLILAWAGASSGDTRVFLTRLNSDGTTPPAWRIGQLWFPHLYVPGVLAYEPSLALSNDGSVFLTFIQLEIDELSPSSISFSSQLLRLTAQGQTPEGIVELGRQAVPESGWRIEPWFMCASDGSGGLYGLLRGSEPYASSPDSSVLVHLDAHGQPIEDWPAEGVKMDTPWRANEPVMLADGEGGVAIGGIVYTGTDSDPDLVIHRFHADGTESWNGFVGGSWSPALVSDPLGGFHAAATDRTNWHSGIGGGRAGLYVRSFVPANSPSAGYEQPGTAPNNTAEYGDVGLAPAGDGGCIAFYVHVVAPEGLLAIRLSPSGQPLDVPLPSPAPGLEITSASWRNGVGVRMRCAIPAGASASLALHDLAGRVVARANDLAPRGSSDVVLAGTSRLVPGIYFVRLRQGAASAHARVVVIP